MDPYKLLLRSTKVSRAHAAKSEQHRPPSGQVSQPQLFREDASKLLGKRKRDTTSAIFNPKTERHLDALDQATLPNDTKEGLQSSPLAHADISRHSNKDSHDDDEDTSSRLPIDERKRILKQHKVKTTLLNPELLSKPAKTRKAKHQPVDKSRCALFPSPSLSLRDLRSRFAISQRLWHNILEQGYEVPTEVQLAALPLLMDQTIEHLSTPAEVDVPSLHSPSHIDLLTVAPTGSGKTLAFMIPLLHSIMRIRKQAHDSRRHTSAVILAPTKELASQITNEGRKLAQSTGITISLMRKGMKLPNDDLEESKLDDSEAEKLGNTLIKADIIVSTPGVLQSAISECGTPLWQIRHLILDEADVLLDPMFREQTLAIWDSLVEPDLRISLWSATMGSNIEDLATSTIKTRIKRLATENGIEVAKVPMIRLVVGLKDSAVPNVSHKLIYAATEKGKLMGLRQLLHPTTSSADSGPALRPPFLIFTQTVERAIALSSELLYDIPAEAGGSSRIAVLHSDLSDTARDDIMTRFRKSEIWVLITTDLLSRGVDFRGVNGVVNFDIPTSSAAYVHRIGRTARAGRDGGVAVTLYSKEDIPYLRHVANVVAMSQGQKGKDTGVQQWLLDALPKLNKNEKKRLKKQGIESRTKRGQKMGSKASRDARISTKAGYVRRVENNRKGAILGSQRRAKADVSIDNDQETDFGGFD